VKGEGVDMSSKLYHDATVMEEACTAGELDVAMKQLPQFGLCFEEDMDGLEGLLEQGAST